MDIIQDIWEDYKKPIIIVLAVILVFITLYVFVVFFGESKGPIISILN